MRRIIFAIFLILSINTNSISAKEKFVLVIDAGHGGKDTGALRGKSKEKNINLGVATELGQMIEDNLSDVKVIYTRKKDVFVELQKRADIANKAKANLFISIHTNSTEAKVTKATGADTYLLGLAKSEENLDVAKRENSVILLENNYSKKYEGFDPNSPESYIIFEFMVNKYIDQSIQFANLVQKKFKTIARIPDRGVRQAGFLVLKQTSMPSVLIEVGFINNPKEAKYLTSKSGQRALASSIYDAFKKYKEDFEKRQGLDRSIESTPINEPVVSKPGKPAKTNKKESVFQSILRDQREKMNAKEQKQQDSTEQIEIQNIATVKPVVEVRKKTESQDKSPTLKKQDDKKISTEKSNAKDEAKASNVDPNIIEYRVQIFVSPSKLNKKSSRFKGLDYNKVNYYFDDGMYKYTYGSTTKMSEIAKIHKSIKSKFKDSFILKFKDNKRLK